MNKFFLGLFIILVLIIGGYYSKKIILPYWFMPTSSSALEGVKIPDSDIEIVATHLVIPWDIAFLPDGDLLVTERPGRLRRIGKVEQTIRFEDTLALGEGGLLGMTLHPDFSSNRWLYLYNTYKKDGKTFNRVERYRYDHEKLSDKKIILDNIPGAHYHDGGRMAFGPEGYLYITSGDASIDRLAQDINSLAGKILRIRDDGSIPEDNPFGNAVYAYGLRNPQGLTWDSSGGLWNTDHGPTGGYDELNLIVKGGNYGWPVIIGDEKKEGMISPEIQSGPNTVWAPASALYWKGSVFFGGLRGVSLFEAKIDEEPIRLLAHFKGQFGRIRTVLMGPDGYFYMTTSNRDGRGFPKEGDDKIIRIRPEIFDKITSSKNR